MGTLRYLLAATVVLWHSGAIGGWHPFNGTASVNYFFLISGFYMTLVLTGKYVGRERLALFWSNRALRLWPSFAFVSVLVVLWRFEEIAAAFRTLDLPSAGLAVTMTTTMIGYEFFDLLSVDGAGRFFPDLAAGGVPAKALAPLGQGWSIGLEIWFYAMAPFVVRSMRRTLLWLALGLVLFVVARYWVEADIWRYRFFPNIMTFFALGALSFHLRRTYVDAWFSRIGDTVAIRFFLPLTFVFLLFPETMGLLVPEQHYLKVLLLIAIPCLPIWFEVTKKWRLDRALGELSYPIYLNHGLVIAVLGPAFGADGWFRSPVVLLISSLFGYVMVRAIERPIDMWRQRRALRIERPFARVSA